MNNKEIELQNSYMAVAYQMFADVPVIPFNSGIPFEHYEKIEAFIKLRHAEAKANAEKFAKEQVAKYPNFYKNETK